MGWELGGVVWTRLGDRRDRGWREEDANFVL